MSDKYKYPAISPSQLSGQQAITGLNGEKLSTLSEYWSWAHSDLLGNTERGSLLSIWFVSLLKYKSHDKHGENMISCIKTKFVLK